MRSFRGDEKTRDFIWKLITPTTNVEADKKDVSFPQNLTSGWAALPEYNVYLQAYNF